MITDLLANESKQFNLQGGRFYFLDGSGVIHVKLNSGGNTRTYKLHVGQGVDYEYESFSSIEIKNDATPQQIEFEVYDKEVFDNRIPGTLQIEEVVPTTVDDVADTALPSGNTDVIAENLARKTLVVYALPTNTDYLKVGPNAAAARGFPLPPGGFISYRGTFEISVHNPSGASQDYGWYSEESE